MNRSQIAVIPAESGHVGSPSPSEIAIAVAAVEAVLQGRVAAMPTRSRRNAWRFSGRTWDAPVPLRRDRPNR